MGVPSFTRPKSSETFVLFNIYRKFESFFLRIQTKPKSAKSKLTLESDTLALIKKGKKDLVVTQISYPATKDERRSKSEGMKCERDERQRGEEAQKAAGLGVSGEVCDVD